MRKQGWKCQVTCICSHSLWGEELGIKPKTTAKLAFFNLNLLKCHWWQVKNSTTAFTLPTWPTLSLGVSPYRKTSIALKPFLFHVAIRDYWLELACHGWVSLTLEKFKLVRGERALLNTMEKLLIGSLLAVSSVRGRDGFKPSKVCQFMSPMLMPCFQHS